MSAASRTDPRGEAQPDAPEVKGWCPGARRPMLSGDGLVVRVRPRFARMTAKTVLALCDLAERYGDGGLEVTSRANLQLYGVAPDDHPALITALETLGLLDANAALEARRNILVTPFWSPGDLTERLTAALLEALPDLPDLPAKVGWAVDTGAAPVLSSCSADLRLERGPDGLILRADGAARGRLVAERDAVPALIEMATWFAETRAPEHRRMRTHVTRGTWVPQDAEQGGAARSQGVLPAEWQTAEPFAPAPTSVPGPSVQGALYGLAFGRVEACHLRAVMAEATALRVTPWRLVLVEGAALARHPGVISDRADPLLTTAACRGAPACPQGSVETRALARRLAARVPGLHVSGCAKGCARATASRVTLVGRDGRFDLVEEGCASDPPRLTGLTPDALTGDLFAPSEPPPT